MHFSIRGLTVVFFSLSLALAKCSGSFTVQDLLNGQSLSGKIKLQSLVALSSTKVRLQFSDPLFIDSALDEENYSVTESDSEAVHSIIGVSRPDTSDSTTVDLIVESLTEGVQYNLLIRNVFSINGRRTPVSGLSGSFIGPVPFASTTNLELDTISSTNSGELITITVMATNLETEDVVLGFDLPLQIQTTGTGSLDVLEIETWDAGVASIYVRYYSDVDEGLTDNIKFEISTIDNNFTVLSDTVGIFQAFTLDHYEVSVDAVVAVGSPFNITITARDKNNNIYAGTDPTDTVFIIPSAASGVFAVANPATGFVDGVLVTPAVYNTGIIGMTVNVILQSDPSITGTSNSFQVQTPVQAGLANYQLLAVPVAPGTLRLTWPKVPETINVQIEEEVTPGVYSSVTTVAGSLKAYHHTGLGDDTSKTYRITLEDVSSAVLYQDTVSGTTMSASGCGNTIGAGTINGLVTWTVAGSPWCITGAVTVSIGGRVTIERGATILIDPAASLTFTSSAELVTEDAGSGLTIITSSDTNNPVVSHGGIVFDTAAGPTIYQPTTDNYLSGSILRHVFYEYGGRVEANLDFKVEDVFFRNNENGAILFDNSSKNVLSNSTFQNNENTGDGGAVTAISNVDVYFCIFEYNNSDVSAGALATATAGSSVTDTLFLGNIAQINGGALTMHGSGSAIRNTYIKNFASQNGGAQYRGSASYSYFYQNEALLSGGAIFHDVGAAFAFRHNYYEENKADSTGAVYGSSLSGGSYTKASEYESYINNFATTDIGALVLVSNNDTTYTTQSYFYQNYSGGTGSQVSMRNGAARTMDVIESVFEKHPLDVAADANIAFVNGLGVVNNSYLEGGAVDCTLALVSGDTTCNVVGTVYPFCVDTDPGADTPTGCVGPSWAKPTL